MSAASEKAANKVHILDGLRKTLCGITFRRERFYNNNTATLPELASCDKCKKIFMDAHPNYVEKTKEAEAIPAKGPR